METILNIDFAILDFIQATIKCVVLDVVMAIFTYACSKGIIWIAAAVTMLFFRKTRAIGVAVLAALILSLLLGEFGIKLLVRRPRPFLLNTNVTLSIVAPSGYSFPSGHTASSFAAAMVIAVRGKRWMGICAFVAAVMIAFSRLYFYVHFPTDVLAGAVLGVLCGLLVLFIFKKTKLDDRINRIGRSKQPD